MFPPLSSRSTSFFRSISSFHSMNFHGFRSPCSLHGMNFFSTPISLGCFSALTELSHSVVCDGKHLCVTGYICVLRDRCTPRLCSIGCEKQINDAIDTEDGTSRRECISITTLSVAYYWYLDIARECKAFKRERR